MEGFQSLGVLPAKLCVDDITANELLENKAKWHKACYIKFATSKLERMKTRMENKRKCTENQCARKSKRSSKCLINMCIFCEEGSGFLHSFSALEQDKIIREMATKLCDTDLLS